MAAVAPTDNEAKIRYVLSILMGIVNDANIPRNIRRAASEAIKYLRDTTLSPGVRAANAVSALEAVSQDPNMPIHARTRIWNAITVLETIKD